MNYTESLHEHLQIYELNNMMWLKIVLSNLLFEDLNLLKILFHADSTKDVFFSLKISETF